MYVPHQALPTYGTQQPMYYADGTRVDNRFDPRFMQGNSVSSDSGSIYNDFDNERKTEMQEQMRRKYRSYQTLNTGNEASNRKNSKHTYESDVEYVGLVEPSPSREKTEKIGTDTRKKLKTTQKVPTTIDVESKGSDCFDDTQDD